MYVKPHIPIYVYMSCVLDPSAFHLLPSLHMCTPKCGLFTFVPSNLHPPPPRRLPSIPRSLICDLFVTANNEGLPPLTLLIFLRLSPMRCVSTAWQNGTACALAGSWLSVAL